VKSAWGDASSGGVAEVAALREMAELLTQENEALRACGASGVLHAGSVLACVFCVLATRCLSLHSVLDSFAGGDGSMTAVVEAQTTQIQALTKELRDSTAKCSSLERALFIARAEISTLQLRSSSETHDIQAVNTQVAIETFLFSLELHTLTPVVSSPTKLLLLSRSWSKPKHSLKRRRRETFRRELL
jgi:hypothetical protein